MVRASTPENTVCLVLGASHRQFLKAVPVLEYTLFKVPLGNECGFGMGEPPGVGQK